MLSFLQTKLEYLKGVGPQKATLLQKELQLAVFADLIQYYPYRYEDRSQLQQIASIGVDTPCVYARGTLTHLKAIQKGKKRLVACLRDDTGEIMLVWFRGLQWVLSKLKVGGTYTVFGKAVVYNQRPSLVHPELEPYAPGQETNYCLMPVYRTTKALRERFLGSKKLADLQKTLLERAKEHVVETLPASLLQRYSLPGKAAALLNIHFPKNRQLLQGAKTRLKFEELFYLQLQLLTLKQVRIRKRAGKVFEQTQLVREFCAGHLPFSLTEAQKRVFREIYQDFQSTHQMNRLVQGDVGSGKTVVAFLSMLMCLESGAQVAMMVPTEILAEQHCRMLKEFTREMGITVQFLTGNTKRKERNDILLALQEGSLQVVVGTHALLNTEVLFRNLGLVVIDEQHRFGVAQRAQLWGKNQTYLPHVLVMTATPIPRTLAMTLYGDLDVSTIDEMPPGRKPTKTLHCYNTNPHKALQLLRSQLMTGKQAYVVYPLIEESEKWTYKNLMDGYENICRTFPEVPVSVIHGQMGAADKEQEMQRFVKGATKIMVATTVIEVGVNVPNATIMLIENAESFGLAQLHQLRGRVGRGNDQAYCVLMTNNNLGAKARERIKTMVRTNDGFEIADVDLKLRGPGDLLGVQQSGVLDLKIADLGRDQKILQAARGAVQSLLEKDPELEQPEHLMVRDQLKDIRSNAARWSRVG